MSMRVFYTFIVLAIVFFLFWSCSKKDEGQNDGIQIVEIYLEPVSLNLHVDQSERVHAWAANEEDEWNDNFQFSWASSDTTVAAITLETVCMVAFDNPPVFPEAIVEAVSCGIAYITASYGGITSDSCIVIITNISFEMMAN